MRRKIIALVSMCFFMALSSGCATRYVSKLGLHRKYPTSVNFAYLDNTTLSIEYSTATYNRNYGPARNPGFCWVAASVDNVSVFTNKWLKMDYVFHEGRIPASITNVAIAIPIVLAHHNKESYISDITLLQRDKVQFELVFLNNDNVPHRARFQVPWDKEFPVRRKIWRYPAMIVGFPVAIAADTVMLPVYLVVGAALQSAFN